MSASPSAVRDPNEQSFYFGKFERTTALKWLGGSTKPGTYLIRRSTSEPDNYTLTLRGEEVIHYQIHNHGECWFSIDNGPMFLGLDDMVDHYSAVPDGLPSVLIAPFPKKCNNERKADPGKGNSPLHYACFKGEVTKIRGLTKEHATKKNYWGRTPMHEAVRGNSIPAAKELVKCISAEKLCKVADDQGWIPIHTASFLGNHEMVKFLMAVCNCIHVKTGDDELARNIASRKGHVQCSITLGLAELGFMTEDKLALRSYPWYHGRLTRTSAEFVLQRNGHSDGLYLMRQSNSGGVQSNMDCVMSMCCEGEYFHYQVIADSITHKYNIDDGPAFKGLDSLVAYYCNKSDGLAQVLRSFCLIGKPVEDKEPTAMMSETAYNIFNADPQTSSPTKTTSQLNIINSNELTVGKKIGSGNFGDVKSGVWHKTGRAIDVALKTIKDLEQNPSMTQEFLKEAADMTSLVHNYVVSILGICMGDGLSIVLELVPLGALETFLRRSTDKSHIKWVKDGYPSLFSRQIVEGMDFLELKRVVHRDLATRNILLKTQHHIKISDFGLSRTLRPEENYYVSTTGGKWPIKWYAPESVNYGKFTAKTDIFSFGVTMWEIYSAAKEPWGDLMMAEVLERLNAGERLEKPRICPSDAYEIMQQCWKMNSNHRPTFAQLMVQFNAKVPKSLSQHVL